IGLQSHLMGLHTSGIHEILAITGDPTTIGDFPGATSVFDVISFELIELIKQSNQGISFSGKSLKEKTSISVDTACNENVANLEKVIKRIRKKMKSGADYILTQPVYSPEKNMESPEATKHNDIPTYVRTMPPTPTEKAKFLQQ